MTDGEKLDTIAGILRLKYQQGQVIPGYIFSNCTPFLCKLLNIEAINSSSWDEEAAEIKKHSPNILDALCGPHFDTVLKVLLIKKGVIDG